MRAPVLGEHAEQTVEQRRIDVRAHAQLRMNALDALPPALDVRTIDVHRREAGPRENLGRFAIVVARLVIEPAYVAAHDLANDGLILGAKPGVTPLLDAEHA